MNMADGATPTLKHVAALAGVSPMTASRSFQAPETVARATREKVEAAAAALGYVADRIAGALRSGHSSLVAAIVPSLVNSLFSATLQGLADGLRERGLMLGLAESSYNPSEMARLCREFLTLRPRGLVLHDHPTDAELRRLLKAADIPVIEVGDLPEDVAEPPVDSVISFSNRAAAAALTRHMIDLGRRRIGLLTLSPKQSRRAAQRIRGWRDALRSAHLPHGSALIAQCAPGYIGGAAGLTALLPQRLDALIGGGDVLALGALLEAQRRGLHVPDDLALASFDAHEVGAALSPRLPMLELPRRAIGVRAAAAIANAERGLRIDLGFSVRPGDAD